jgi:uncharacterized membrane protein YeaQ/YmgE (transglycosylase-associated protein family)
MTNKIFILKQILNKYPLRFFILSLTIQGIIGSIVADMILRPWTLLSHSFQLSSNFEFLIEGRH